MLVTSVELYYTFFAWLWRHRIRTRVAVESSRKERRNNNKQASRQVSQSGRGGKVEAEKEKERRKKNWRWWKKKGVGIREIGSSLTLERKSPNGRNHKQIMSLRYKQWTADFSLYIYNNTIQSIRFQHVILTLFSFTKLLYIHKWKLFCTQQPANDNYHVYGPHLLIKMTVTGMGALWILNEKKKGDQVLVSVPLTKRPFSSSGFLFGGRGNRQTTLFFS